VAETVVLAFLVVPLVNVTITAAVTLSLELKKA
jgi:hypothetical protein